MAALCVIWLVVAARGSGGNPSQAEVTPLFDHLEAKRKDLTLWDKQLRERTRALVEEKKRHADDFASREKDLQQRAEFLDGREENFKQGFCRGRQWLADLIAESEESRDRVLENHLRMKKCPALRSADLVRGIREEKKKLVSKVKFLEFVLRSYEEYFPFLEDYREAIIDERIPLSNGRDNRQAIDEADPTTRFLDKDEYHRLSPSERNQLALQRYLTKSFSKWEIGRLYERFIGHLHEKQGWKVVYQGAIKGYEDFGRDLICSKDQITKIIQCKCWSKDSVIREKHIFQLFGTAVHFHKSHPDRRIIAQFFTTTKLSEEAEEVAKALKIRVFQVPLEKDYPMIKCNINPATKERIYHLPFDQQYDRIVIGNLPGEQYARTAQEAEEKLGFRRAYRWRARAA